MGNQCAPDCLLDQYRLLAPPSTGCQMGIQGSEDTRARPLPHGKRAFYDDQAGCIYLENKISDSYPLTAPAVSPEMICFAAIKVKIRGGKAIRTPSAVIFPHSTPTSVI